MSHTIYEKLISHLKRLHALQTTLSLLHWDEQVNLPRGAADQRAEQTSVLADLHHREFTQPAVREWLEELEEAAPSLSSAQKTVLRIVRRDHDRATRLPSSFVMRRATGHSKAYHAWATARERDDFASYAPFLEENIRIAQEEAMLQGFEQKPYDYHIDCHDPGLTSGTVAALFDELKPGLRELAGTILESPVKADSSFLKGFPVEDQERFLQEVVRHLGFSFDHGRIDRSLHPFCSGSGADIRMTTRFSSDHPLDSLYSSIHEAGHALYEQGLPARHRGTPLGRSVGMAIHESQSRLWENQVGRGRSFWRYFEPRYRNTFPEQLSGVSSEQLYLAVNAVTLHPIRVESDEVTYNLHIFLRFELEKALFDGSVTVKDLPGEWNRLSKSIIGLSPPDDRHGILQDIHWSGGGFGYFPSYCLGNMAAAQLWEAAGKDHPDLEARFAEGDFSVFLEWLRTRIHAHGQRFDTLELIRNATGADLSSRPLITYLRDRYVPLYGQ